MSYARIAEVRKQRKISLREAAEKLGVSIATIQRYETINGIKNIPLDNIKAYADLLNVNPAYLIGWTDSPEPDSDVKCEQKAQIADDNTRNFINTLQGIPEPQRGKLVYMLESLMSAYIRLEMVDMNKNKDCRGI